MNSVKTLILSDSKDFASDYVSIELEKRGENYLRLDRDLLHKSKISWCLNDDIILVEKHGVTYQIDQHSLSSVFFRAPTFLRETFRRDITPEDQIKNSQWMAFFRNLSSFESSNWMNNPVSTYKAENKILQLKVAKSIGFRIPETTVLNSTEHFNNSSDELIFKSLDTALFKFGEQEAFVYTNSIKKEELEQNDLSLAPIIVQNNLTPKIDFRVTVAGSDIYSVEILKDKQGVEGDWRLLKDSVTYRKRDLPSEIEAMCFSLLKSLDLSFGAIDLILHNDEYFFIEVNPTGEWAWLVDACDMKIYRSICDYLVY